MGAWPHLPQCGYAPDSGVDSFTDGTLLCDRWHVGSRWESMGGVRWKYRTLHQLRNKYHVLSASFTACSHDVHKCIEQGKLPTDFRLTYSHKTLEPA